MKIERVGGRRWLTNQQRTLAEVIEEQCGQHEEEPGIADRLAAEVAHIRIQRFGAGDRQHHRAQYEKTVTPVLDEEIKCKMRADRVQHFWRFHHVIKAHHCECDKPQDHDGAEPSPHAARTVALNGEQEYQRDERYRYHQRPEYGRDNL